MRKFSIIKKTLFISKVSDGKSGLTPNAKVLARISITKNHREEHLNKIFDVIS